MKILKTSKGFTLMEMLIVVAIIAVLVAIAIPTFTNQLEKAREATDLANLRGAYAQVMAAALTNSAEDASINLKRDGDDGAAVWSIEVSATQTVANWQTKDVKVADIAMTDDICATKGGKNWIVSYSEATGKASIALAQ